MVMKSVGFRLGTEGKSEVVNDFAAIGTAGKAAFADVAEGAETSATRAAAATDELAERQQRAYQKVAAAAANSGLNSPTPQAYASPRAANDDLAAVKMAAALKGEIDPLWAATQRLNRELERLAQIERLGVLSAEELAQAQGLARRRFDETVVAIERNAVAQSKGASSAGAHRQAMQGLSYQAQDTFTQLSMGANVLQVLAIQGGQAAGQMAHLEGKAGNVARFMLGGWGLAFTAALLVVGALTEGMFEQGETLDAVVKKLADDARQTRATEQAKQAFARTLVGLTAAIDDQIRALEEERKASQSSAERANIDAKQHAEKVLRIREETAARIANIRAMLQEDLGDTKSPDGNRQFRIQRAQQLLPDLEKRAADAEAAVAKAQIALNMTRTSLADESVARQGDATKRINKMYDDQAAAARIAADKEIKAGRDVTAEYRRKKAEIEANRQRDLKAEEDRQSSARASEVGGKSDSETLKASAVAKMLREALPGVQITATTNGKHVAGSDHYKNQAVDFVPAGGMATLSKDDIREIFRDRGIPIRINANGVEQLFGPGDPGHSDHFHVAWTKGKLALDDFNDAAKRAADRKADLDSLAKAFDPAKAAADDYAKTLAKIAAAHLDPATAARYAEAARAAFEKAKDAAMTQRASSFTLQSVEEVRPDAAAYEKDQAEQAEREKRRAEYVQRFAADQAEALQYSQAELALVGASDDVREATLSKLRLTNQLLGSGVDLTEEQIANFLAIGDEIEANTAKAKVQAAAWNEIRGFGNQFVDTVLSPDTWSSWGNAGKTILNELKTEFIKLALLNPLKNLINGDNALPTFGSLIKSIGSFAGPGRNATGTEFWSGGVTWVAENGPELINLPAGAKVTPAAQTRQLLAAAQPGAGAVSVKHFHFEGAVMTQDLLDQMNAAANDATVAGAVGGSQLARADAMATNKRKLGRRW